LPTLLSLLIYLSLFVFFDIFLSNACKSDAYEDMKNLRFTTFKGSNLHKDIIFDTFIGLKHIKISSYLNECCENQLSNKFIEQLFKIVSSPIIFRRKIIALNVERYFYRFNVHHWRNPYSCQELPSPYQPQGKNSVNSQRPDFAKNLHE